MSDGSEIFFSNITQRPLRRSWKHGSNNKMKRYATTVIKNPQKDEEGNDMCIEITNRAVTQLKYISGQEKIFNNALRVAVDSGGCHGFQYFYDLIDSNSIKEDDV
ncbi:hypothetical protein RhiirB3_527738 [Rhizophagus irregularis]|nr:hypothetical protein RhiirB3_527738 [Rhizophagus irregularis]